jgi:hypothetical protein
MQPIRFYSSSISRSSKDQEFADRPHSRMVQEQLRTWHAPEDLRGGIRPRSTGGRRNADDSLQFGAARFGRIDRSHLGPIGFGVVGPKRATAREPDTALAALKTGKILLTHATANTEGAGDHLIVPEV